VLAPAAAGRICCFGVASVIPKLLKVLSVKWGMYWVCFNIIPFFHKKKDYLRKKMIAINQ
jgi:hypothetical protein